MEQRVRFGLGLDGRLGDLEGDGIVAEVLFPDSLAPDDPGIPFSGAFGAAATWGPEFLAAGYRAYNRWQAETIEDHDRQIGLAFVSYHNVDAAVAEIHWARRVQLKGVYLDGVHPDYPPLFDPYYDPIWRACVDEALPVVFHGGSGTLAARRATGRRSVGLPEGALEEMGAGKPLVSIMELNVFDRRPLWFMVNGGVCARYPDLKIVFTEQGCTWAPPIIAWSDYQWEQGLGRGDLPLKPSEYYSSQVFFAASNSPSWELQQRHLVGIHNFMWGSDHPHVGSPMGATTEWIRLTFGAAEVPEDEARAILGENAIQVYGLDRAKLEATAERVGPVVDEVLRPPEDSDYRHPAVKRMVDPRAARP
jgi:predicted TIM-barrel fold metal-dependent hydrolase